MCGIAGIATTSDWNSTFQTALESLLAQLKDRGPDDQGLWLSPSGHVGLAHTRLSILDLTTAGHQPMTDPSGRYHLTFNGEIYNFRDLRSELEAEGEHFQSHSDTEVLLRLYIKQGRAMVSRLRGMFAFAIWDEEERSVFLARDPFGIKPLYYSAVGECLVFASKLQAIRRSGLVKNTLEPRALQPYFETGSIPEPLTLLKDVQMLEAGHWALWKKGTFHTESYWKPCFESAGPTTAEPAAFTRAALLDSLQAHFVSDTPVGLFLSGGIDSTVLTALAGEMGVSSLATFAIGVDDPATDESNLARRTAAHFNTNHHELQLNATSCEALFHDFLNSVDQPSIDGINTYTVASFARKQGMKVVLSGLGGDELFGGYPSFQKVPQLARFARLAATIAGVGNLAGRCLEHLSPDQRLRRIGTLLQRPPTIPNAFRAFRGIFSAQDARYLAAQFLGSTPATFPNLSDPECHATHPLDAVSECELTLYMRNQLLRESDVMSMAHGLELRVPFVDKVLFDSIAQIPAPIRLRSGKQLLLEAVPEIPQWVFEHPKRGFLFPYEKWLDAKWGETFRSANTRIPFSNPSWYQRWAVFMLEHWISHPF